MMKKLFSRVIALAMILSPFTTNAQVVHFVEAGSYYYTPQVLEIETGDIVTWTNAGGTHDVNFDVSTLSGQSFGNPSASSLGTNTSGDMGSITFDVAGTYNYDCSIGQHAANGMTGTIIVSQAAGFFPPEGSVYNSDSTEVTLPSAAVGSAYDNTISFYATNEIEMDMSGTPVALEFISAEILSVNIPDGMSTSCNPGDCFFGPQAWGEVNLTGTPTNGGVYNLNLSAMVTINLTNLGIPSDLTFPVPYNGENAILNMALAGDYSAVNGFIPNFVLNVDGDIAAISGCTDASATNYNADATEDDGSCDYPSVSEGVRYVDEIFSDVTISSDVQYGSNIGILTQAPVLENLYMDVYEPTGDTETNRAVVVMLHTGSFLPAIVNGQATGDKSDNAIVEACKRYAKKGYVAVAVNYRLGWNPVSTSEDVRRSTLIQAAYRGLQDTKTAVRYLRKSAAEDGNPYGVGNKFAVGGNGTGGYLSLAMATLNDYESELLMPKFIDTSAETLAAYGQPMPYIIQSMWGNFEATNYGWHPAYDLDGDGVFMDVPLCIPNHVGYSSEVDMVFNAGGALPDISWLEAGEVPIASMQNILDPDAPYAEGNVIVPTTGEFVIVAHGSQLVQENATALGNNDVFAGMTTSITDAWYSNGNGAANAATAGHADLPGLFGMITPTPSAAPTACGFQTVQNAPWDSWDNATYGAMADGYHGMPSGTMGCLALLGSPDMSTDKMNAMLDMMDEFFAPRIHAALSIEAVINEGPTEQVISLVQGWSMFSTYMMADNMQMDVVVAPVLANVVIAKDYLGSAYLPEWNFNGIGDIQIGQGYQIKMLEGADLVVSGTYMAPEENPIELVSGWNMIGYLRLEGADAGAVLADLVDAGVIEIAKDYLGSAFLPAWNFNGIGDLNPGMGYQVKTNEAATLTLNANDTEYRYANLKHTSNTTTHFETAVNTGSNMTIGIFDEAWEVTPSIGDEISVFNSNGELVGSAKYTSPVTVLSVWGDDVTTTKVDGLVNAESMTFKVWNNRYNTTDELVVTNWIEGSNAYQTDAVNQIGEIGFVSNTANSSKLGLYPIPANKELNLELTINQAQNITVGIYNLLGKVIETTSYQLEKGFNSIELNISPLQEGAYLCTITTNEGTNSRKFNVIK
jgi:plastocyanin